MSASSRKINLQTSNNRKYMATPTNEIYNDDCDSFLYHQPQSFNSSSVNFPPFRWQPIKYHPTSQRQPSKPTQPWLKTSRGARRRNNMEKNKDSVSRDQPQQTKVPDDAVEFNPKHLEALKASFDKILQEQFLSNVDYDGYLRIYNHLRGIILEKRPDAQITLYGSLLFKCCLKGPNTIDIDIQFNEISPSDTLNEVLEIVRKSVYCKEAHINVDHEPSSIDLYILPSNVLVRLTSNNTRDIQLSKIIEMYTKFDERVLPLLRLFRIFSKTCSLDRPDLGTFHPIVFHLMLIYFLQQLDPPILPCLYEKVFGIDKSPVALNNDEYAYFFQVCNIYADQWKSKNTTSLEMIFLQFLSYYVRKFNIARFAVSIQTRMPILKNENQMFDRKLFCIDPTTIDRNLCSTMKAPCSFKYFQRTLKTALNYFCQRHTNLSSVQLINILDKSYTLFIDHFPKEMNRLKKLQQEDILQYYKKTLNNKENPLLQPILTLNKIQLVLTNADEKNIEKISSHDLDTTNGISFSSENIEEPMPFVTLSKYLNKNQLEVLHKAYDQQVKIFNNKMQQILNDIKSLPIIETSVNEIEQTISTDVTSSIYHVEFFYDMQAKNFGAEKGAPSVCQVCYKNDHVKLDCPELSLSNIIQLPKINQEWINVITHICGQVTDQCKASTQDMKNREEILKYIQNLFKNCYPLCCVYAYGSFNNGFGLRQSDLDICVMLKDNYQGSNILVLEKLSQTMKSNSHIFKNIKLLRHARVPIIRSIHSQYGIEIDISLHNVLAMENTRLLKMYTEIDSRVSELGYMIKYLVKTCNIGDASTGKLSSYAYIIMLIHFLQQIRPSVLPVLQQLNNNSLVRKCDEWNVYFYDDLSKLKQVWVNENGPNTLKIGELWIEFLRYYTEQFDYKTNVVTIRQFEPLRRDEKGWLKSTIAIEDPFVLTHNLGGRLSVKKWTLIHRVFIQARQRFCLEPKDVDIYQFNWDWIQEYLFDTNILCPENVVNKKQSKKTKPVVTKKEKQRKCQKVFEANRTVTPFVLQ